MAKNQSHVLIPAGRWELAGFHHGKSRCVCCGRRITHIHHLKNVSHAAKIQQDPSYDFPDEIEIGMVCGPKVFALSAAAFYDDPAMEWARQYEFYREFIQYELLCSKAWDVWSSMSPEFRRVTDEIMATEVKDGSWWRVRDAKKHVLRTKRFLIRDGGGFCKKNLAKRIRKLEKTLIQVGALPFAIELVV